jgi:SAM-dependent methyltransferase
MTTDEAELRRWRETLAQTPTGWDFSTLPGFHEEEPPWRWRTAVEALAPKSDRVLDLGTGGGEVLSSLLDLLPEGTVATEGWAPNLPVARARLEPLGIEVHAHDAEVPGARLPFPAESFDLVLSRHEAYDAADVARVLRPDGAFLTQQVGGDDSHELRDAFGHPAPHAGITLEAVVHDLVAAGLRVDRSDSFHGRYRFEDVTAVLGYLRRTPWNAPADLDVDRHRTVLEGLRDAMAEGPFEATVSRFVVLARALGAPDTGRVDFAQLPRGELEVPRV